MMRTKAIDTNGKFSTFSIFLKTVSIANIPFIPENNGGVNWEKCGGRNKGGCPLSINGRKLPLKRIEMRKLNQNIKIAKSPKTQELPFRESLNTRMTSETTGEHIINIIIVLTALRVLSIKKNPRTQSIF